MASSYNDPVGGTDSSVGSQTRTDYYNKKALVEVAKEAYFGQMANSIAMPKNMGKKITQFHILPMLDDRNQNDQGIDASAAISAASALKIAYVSMLLTGQPVSQTKYFRGTAASAAAALLEAKANANAFMYSLGFTVTQANTAADYTALIALATTYTHATIAATAATPYGNLYGSSKDIGTIQGKIPVLSESGGRVNRVGHKRIQLEGKIEKFGFFDEYTQESLDFDSDVDLQQHIVNETTKAANEQTEDQLQIDLINGAGVVRYTGAATSIATLQGDFDTNLATTFTSADSVTYDDLVKLNIELDNNRCPKNTNVLMGSRMVDTKVINAARYIYVGSELQPSIMRMVDYHGNKAFIPVAQYAEAGQTARGEFGSVDGFRFIVAPEMMHHTGSGAAVSDPETTPFRHGAAAEGASLKYNAYPMLVVGDGSFTTIGFQTDGKSVKFKIKHKKPEETHDRSDPYGETGFYSIKWYYGMMVLRPERLAVMWTVAEW